MADAPQMAVRHARLDDAEGIRTIYNAAVEHTVDTFDIVPRTLAEQQTWIAAHQGVHPAVVAVGGDQVAGFGALSEYRPRPAYATSVENSVYVAEGYRRRGVGRLILERLLDLAREHGFHAVIARIGGGNEASIGLHAACGFEMVGTEREVGRKFGRWLDVVVMERLL